MTDEPIAALRRLTTARGYFVREGSLRGTPDNKVGHWYWGRVGIPIDFTGPGLLSERAAHLAIIEFADEAEATR